MANNQQQPNNNVIFDDEAGQVSIKGASVVKVGEKILVPTDEESH
jgi:hypothetical protein